MATTVTAIYRYPVKGLSAEKMDRVALMPGECLPHDRRFAIALGTPKSGSHVSHRWRDPDSNHRSPVIATMAIA